MLTSFQTHRANAEVGRHGTWFPNAQRLLLQGLCRWKSKRGVGLLFALEACGVKWFVSLRVICLKIPLPWGLFFIVFVVS